MQELLGKIGRFCESHVEKIVLIIVGGVSAYLFFTRVIFSPNAVEYEQKRVSPSRIDTYISQEADELRGMLVGVEENSTQKEYVSLLHGEVDSNDPLFAETFASRPAPENFMELFTDPLSFLRTDDLSMQAGVRQVVVKKYALPTVGPVTDVAASHLRAAAYVPIEPVTASRDYTMAAREPNDIDLVTVEAKFNVAELYRQFRAYFNGTEVEKREWRDPDLATPEFAGVQLQRQRRLADGTWSDWVDVPRCRVEQYASLLTPIEKVKDLPPGGVPVRKMQLGSRRMTMAMLQPEGYQIASPDEDWLPPSFYGKFKDLQSKMEMEQRRRDLEERRNQREADNEESNNRRGGNDTTTGRTNRAAGSRRGGTPGGIDNGVNNRRGGTGRTRGRGDATANDARGREVIDPRNGGRLGQQEQTTTDEAYLDFAEVLIGDGDTTDLSDMDDLLFWAFDDTAEPGGTYRYRIRLGVFNPVAGTDMLVERDMDMKDQAILWSGFSDVTDTIAIPRRLYFFARSVQSGNAVATVEVARYALGRWYKEDFQVQPGEVIGREMAPPEPEEDEDTAATGRITTGRNIAVGQGMAAIMRQATQTTQTDDPTVPDMIDYRTGAMLVDFVEATDLGTPPNLQPRPYRDMLYTRDGVKIEHMPTTQSLWPEELRQVYQTISRTRNDERKPFRAFTSSSRISGRTGGRR